MKLAAEGSKAGGAGGGMESCGKSCRRVNGPGSVRSGGGVPRDLGKSRRRALVKLGGLPMMGAWHWIAWKWSMILGIPERLHASAARKEHQPPVSRSRYLAVLGAGWRLFVRDATAS